MAQPPKKERASKHSPQQDSPIIPERFQHPAAIVVLFISLLVFFHQAVFNGKVFVSSDSVAGQSWKTMMEDAEKQGTVPLWNPYIFCGMPGVASMTVSGPRTYDLSAYLLGKASALCSIVLMNREVGWVLFYYFVLAGGVYLFAYSKLRSKLAAMLVALATLYSTYIAIWVIASHVTKIAVIAFFPYIFYVVEQLREKFRWTLSVLLVLLMHFLFLPGHIQMIFYTGFALLVYYIFFLVHALVKRENWVGVARSGAILAVASVLAFAMTADQYLSTLEYSKYSIRGADPVQAQQQPGSQTAKKATGGGLDYDYATNWSLSPGELLTFVVPSAYGFGTFDYSGPLTNNQPIRRNFYFGPQMFTDAPQYMGIGVLVLAIIGFMRHRRDPFVQYLAILSFIALLIAFGRELPILYNLMFNYFPMFNKFRIPSMILVLVQLAVPILAGYGVLALLSLRDRPMTPVMAKRWKYILFGLAGAAVVSLIARPIVESIYSMFFPQKEVGALLATRNYPPSALNAIYEIVSGAVATDVSVALIVLTLLLGSAWLYIQRSIKLPILGFALVVVILLDLWRVDMKTMEPRDAREAHIENFGMPDHVQYLLKDTTLYRTLEFENGQPPYSNTLAYWRIQSAYGYQGAKMRAYQDIAENVGMANPLVWGLMNVRYIVSNTRDSSGLIQPVFQGRERIVYYNRAELPRAFFVNRYEVKGGAEILNSMKTMSFNPRDVAYLPEDPKLSIQPPEEGASAKYKKYDLNKVEIAATATGWNLLFVSETYYPEGWKAFIDGVETPIYRLNYLFRGVVVPPGQHTLTMSFEPRGYYVGKTLSLAANILVIGYFVGMAGVAVAKRRKPQSPSA
jgi:hypothetical protein